VANLVATMAEGCISTTELPELWRCWWT